MEKDVLLAAAGCDGLDGLNDTGLVVGGHDRDEGGVWANCCEDGLGLHGAVCVGSNEGDLVAFRLEGFGCGENGVVFDGGADDVAAFVAMGFCESEDGEVVRFGA